MSMLSVTNSRVDVRYVSGQAFVTSIIANGESYLQTLKKCRVFRCMLKQALHDDL